MKVHSKWFIKLLQHVNIDQIPKILFFTNYNIFVILFNEVYLIIGVMFVMLVISVFNQIPQLNFAKYFSIESDAQDDPQRPLLGDSSSHQPAYNRQINDDEQTSNNNNNNNINKSKP
jgi:hypothetical protein